MVELADKIKRLESENSSLIKERDQLKHDLDKMALDYKIVPETQREITVYAANCQRPSATLKTCKSS